MNENPGGVSAGATSTPNEGSPQSNGEPRQDPVAAPDDPRTYLDAVFGDMTGVAHVAVGSGPHLSNGKYSFAGWSEHQFKWPDEADLMVGEILRAAPLSDVYVCPYLMWDNKRTKSSAVARRLVHADVDNGLLDPEKVRQLGGFAVASGSPGNGHAYAHLSASVTVPEHNALCRALGAHLGAVDHKIVTSDVLRPVGSYNHKSALSGGEPTLVRWLVRP